MAKITTTGLDIAKNVFHALCCDERGKMVKKRMLKRGQVLTFFARMEPCLIGMEACASAHWGSLPAQPAGARRPRRGQSRGQKDDKLSCWINKIRAKRGINKATVALANKMARIGWVILAHQTIYKPVVQV